MGIRKLLGFKFPIEDESGEATITREEIDRVYIDHPSYGGWMFKADFWERWGHEESFDGDAIPQ
jgi:hypothetical protein